MQGDWLGKMLVSNSDLPRIPATTIRRDRLERWLRSHLETPLRLVIAPAGSGKTSLLVKYASSATGDVAYCALLQNATPDELHGAIARALGSSETPASYEEMLAFIHSNAGERLELIVDDAGDGVEETISELHRLVEGVDDRITLIYAARSLDRIAAGRLIARGLAEACDARRMKFDEAEARALADACGIEPTDQELAHLVADTDGWALALSCTIRSAAIENETLINAYKVWRGESESFLHEFVESELTRVPADEADVFRTLLAGCDADPSQLRALQARGLFIATDADGTLRLYHVLRMKLQKPPKEPAQHRLAPLLSVKMLGSFQARIGEREIPWVRKRDQQIFKYLMLKPDGRATRAELRNVFWNGTDHHLATQSMRTAFSTLRRAIAAVVGYDQVESYFRTVPDVHLVLDHIVCDVRRFIAHVSEGEAAFDRNDTKEAAFHYRAAEKLYGGPLLEADGTEPWLAAHAMALHERHLLVLERLADIALELGEMHDARQYAMRAARSSPGHSGIAALLQRTSKAERGDLPRSIIAATSDRSVASGSVPSAP